MDPADTPDDADDLARRYRLCRAGFILLGLGLLLRAADVALHAAMLLTLGRPPFFDIIHSPLYGWVVRAPMVLMMIAGPYRLYGRWTDRAWLRRSGALIVLGLMDLVLWGLDHQQELGFGSEEVGHEWFRMHLARAVSWHQLLFGVGLIGDFQDHLEGRWQGPRARGVLGFLAIGMALWVFYFIQMTDWRGGWPLAQRIWMPPQILLLLLAYLGLLAVAAVQLAGASWACAAASSVLAREVVAYGVDPGLEALRSRSELEFEFEEKGREKPGRGVSS